MTRITVKPKYEQLKERLKKELSSGKYLPGGRFYSQNELARYYGISFLTAREAISALVQEGLLTRIHGKGTFLADYMQFGNSRNVGIVIHSSELYAFSFFNEINRGISLALKNTDYHSLLLPFDEAKLSGKQKQARENQFLVSLAKKKRIAGFLVTASQVNEQELLNLQTHGIPFVMLNCFYPERDFSFVCGDYLKSSYFLTRHLIRLGHKEIIYLGGFVAEQYPIEKIRLAGYKKALLESGLKYNPELMVDWPYGKWEDMRPLFGKLEKKFGKGSFPTAIYCASDLIAFETMRYFTERGFRIPEDIAVVGVGNFKFSEHFQPPLTTVEFFREEMGRQAAKALLGKIFKKSKSTVKTFLEPKLIIRESCGFKMQNKKGGGKK